MTTISGCAWTATPMVDWIVIMSGASGSGSGTVQIRVMNAPPNQLPRTGTLTIGGRTFTANQQE